MSPPPPSATPLPKWTPPDHHAGLSDAHRALLDDLVQDFGEDKRNMLGAFLTASNWDDDVASEGLDHMLKVHAELPSRLPYDDLLELIGKDARNGRPLPCVVALEDGHGNIARNKDGMPILCMHDHMEGDQDDWIRQVHFAVERVRRYAGPKEFPSVCFVLDAVGSTKDPESVNNLKFLRYIRSFPGQYRVHFAGMKAGPVAAALMKPFVDMIGASRIRMGPGHETVIEDIDEANRLPQWGGGTFDMDLDKYKNWLRESL